MLEFIFEFMFEFGLLVGDIIGDVVGVGVPVLAFVFMLFALLAVDPHPAKPTGTTVSNAAKAIDFIYFPLSNFIFWQQGRPSIRHESVKKRTIGLNQKPPIFRTSYDRVFERIVS